MSDHNQSPNLTPSLSSVVGDSLVEPHPPRQESQLTFGFAPQRWRKGALHLVEGVGLMGAGAFLLYEIPATPALKVQMAILSAILIAGGLFILPKVIVDFFGKIQIDETGIHMSPSVVDFTVPWPHVVKWEIRDGNGTTASHCIRVWSKTSSRTHTVPAGFLSYHDLHLLRRVLLTATPTQKVSR